MNFSKKYILSIESSCDDSSVAIVDSTNGNIIDCLTLSSSEKYLTYGGIVPEIAARSHENVLLPLVEEITLKNNISLQELSHIAYTSNPGLLGSLFVGKLLAESLTYILGIPIIPVNHIYGHIFSVGITNEFKLPNISLVISGKTTALYYVKGVDDIELLEETLDNAIGEAYDKVGRYAGLTYPAAKIIDSLFDYNLSVPPLLSKSINIKNKFSYSGIITESYKWWNKIKDNNSITNKEVYFSTLFQSFVINSLIKKLNYWLTIKSSKYINISGGVASNLYLQKQTKLINAIVNIVDKKYSTDNAAMIGYYAFLLLNKK